MIDELEKLARAAHDPGFPWVDRDAMIGGLFAKGEIDYIAAAKPADILELINRIRELEGMIAAAPTQPAPADADKEAVRNAALEEAEVKAWSVGMDTYNYQRLNDPRYIGSKCAENIRALKTASVSEVSQPAQPPQTGFAFCEFVGAPPEGFANWHEWIKEPIHSYVRISRLEVGIKKPAKLSGNSGEYQ